jgi:lipopolysaccharide transport system permease protein
METSETTIRPRSRRAIDPRELWNYRELFYFFAWRDIKVRYKQTAIGAGWAILQPFVTMVVFTVFFHNVAGIKSGGIPYPVFAYTGLLFFSFFSVAVVQVSNSLVNNSGPITKIYFPRVIPPAAATLLSVVDFFFAGLIFVGLVLYYRVSVGWLGVLLVVPMLLLTLVFSLGIGIIFASLNVKYRDVRAALPFVMTLWLFVTPVIYPVSLIAQRFQWAINLNPMAGVVTTMRAALLHQGVVKWNEVAISAAVAVLSLVLGLMYFSRAERRFPDII